MVERYQVFEDMFDEAVEDLGGSSWPKWPSDRSLDGSALHKLILAPLKRWNKSLIASEE